MWSRFGGMFPFWATCLDPALSGTLDGSAGSAIAFPGLLSTSHGSPGRGRPSPRWCGVAVQLVDGRNMFLYPAGYLFVVICTGFK